MGAEKIIEAFRLLTTCIGVVQNPSLLGFVNAGPGFLDSFRKLAASPPASYARLAETLAEQAVRTLAALPEKPRDAELLYVQMVELSLPDPARIMADRMNAAAVTEGMLARLTEREHRDPAMQALFRALTQPALERLLADKAFAADLMPFFMQAVLRGFDEKDSPAREILDGIAQRFGEPKPEVMSLGELKGFLVNKASDYRNIKAEIEALRGVSPQIDSVLAQVEAALERFDFAAAEALLSDLREITKEASRKFLEDNARVMEAQAKVALLRGGVREACRLLTNAADSFAGMGSAEQSTRLLMYAAVIFMHGQRYGGDGIIAAEEMWRQVIEKVKKSKQPVIWASAQDSLAGSLRVRGERTGGDAGAALLHEAIDAYRAALPVWVRVAVREKAHWVLWATTQHNLGTAYRACGQMVGGDAEVKMYRLALNSFGKAIRVFTRKFRPIEWADLQNAVGATLTAMAKCLKPDETDAMLQQAVDVLSEALEVRTRLGLAVEGASTQNNLGIALWMQGQRMAGERGAAKLGKAIEAFNAALSVRTEKNHPIDWALTIENLGSTKEWLAENETCADRRSTLADAAACFEAALTQFDPKHMPYNHATASEALARVRAELAGLPDPA